MAATPDDPPAEAETQRTTLFLSYAHADRVRAEKIGAALTAVGLEVWWDALIEAGTAFAKSIEAALEAADGVVVLWSKTSVESDWVRDEAARGRDLKRLIPISLDGSEPPLGFRQYQTIDLSKWRGRADEPEFASVLRRIEALGGQPLARPVVPRPRPSRRGVMGAGVGAVAVLGGGSGLWAWHTGLFGVATDPTHKVAVIPFANLSGDPTQDYFSDGLSEEIRGALSRNNLLEVLAATSSNTARAHKEDAVAVAKRLGVDYMLEGSVRRAGDVLRIAAELIDGRTGFSRWTNSFDRKTTDVFAVQSEIAGKVSEALTARIATDAPTPGSTTNVAAYEAFLRGRALFNLTKDEPTDRAALAQYDLAIAADPKFAMAHAARSRSLAAIAGEYAKAAEVRPTYDAAVAASERAVALAPDLAEAHLARGYALFVGRLAIQGARESYDKAYALGRGNADIVLLFALYCARAGRPDDARTAIAHAISLDPLNPRAFRAAGSIAYVGRRYGEALAPLQQALTLNPKITNAHGLIGFVLLQQGKPEDAKAALSIEPNPAFRLTGLAIAEKRLGNESAAQQAMAKLVTELGETAAYQQGEVFAQWGDKPNALKAINRAQVVGDPGLIFLATDPLLDPVRQEPEFIALQAELLKK